MDSENFESQINVIPTWDKMMDGKKERLEDLEANVFHKIQFDNAKILYNSWREIATFLFAFSDQKFRDNLDLQTRNFIDDIIEVMQETIVRIPAKIYSAAWSEAYFLQMENAAMIRSEVIHIDNTITKVAMFCKEAKEQVVIIKEMILEFKEYYKNWVASFRKDEQKDDWGLFN